jgi:signal transduction histidine kinase
LSERRRFDFGSWSTFGQTALLIFAALMIAQLFAIFLLRNIIEQWRSYAVVQPAVTHFADVAARVEASPVSARTQIVNTAIAEGQDFDLAPAGIFFGPERDSSLTGDLSAALKKRNVKVKAVHAFLHGGILGRGPIVGFSHRETRPPPVKDFSGPPIPRDFAGGPPPRDFGPNRGSPSPTEAAPAPDMTGPVKGTWPVIVTTRQPPEGGFASDGAPPSLHPDRFRMAFRTGGPGEPPPGQMNETVHLAAQLPDGTWLIGRFLSLRPLPIYLNPIFVVQLALFIAVLGISLFWASRISRPMRVLARAAENLRPQENLAPIPEEGPRDVRSAIVSFNAMARRVKDLLEEKDRMLSAIGHDMRTPLASLRIRAESVEPESERERIVETIDEMTRMVDEILSLARLGRSSEKMQLVDLSALTDSVVEEFRELGKDVTFEDAPRTPLTMQPLLVRRLLRNLIDNAVKYGGRALVSIADQGGTLRLIVDDDGPGIPQAQMADVLQPFTRLENSRSRETGGMGLGLSIAEAISRSQGARLILENRHGGGLRAAIEWRRSAAA